MAKKLIKYRLGRTDFVITDTTDTTIWFDERAIYRNIFDGTIVAKVLLYGKFTEAVFVQLSDKTKMLIKEGDFQHYINRFIYESEKQNLLSQALNEITNELGR